MSKDTTRCQWCGTPVAQLRRIRYWGGRPECINPWSCQQRKHRNEREAQNVK